MSGLISKIVSQGRSIGEWVGPRLLNGALSATWHIVDKVCVPIVSTLSSRCLPEKYNKPISSFIDTVIYPTPSDDAAIPADHQAILEIFSAQLPTANDIFDEDSFIRRAGSWAMRNFADKYISEYSTINNDTSNISESSKNVVASLFGNFESTHLNKFWDKALDEVRAELEREDNEFNEDLPHFEVGIYRSSEFCRTIAGDDEYFAKKQNNFLFRHLKHWMYRGVIHLGVKFIDPIESPKLYNFLKGKLESIILLTVEEFLIEGRRIQSQDPKLQNLNDEALILLGATSVASFVAKELLNENANPEEVLSVLARQFPGFAKINIPPKLVEPLMDAIKNKGLVEGITILKPLTALTKQLDQINEQLIAVWGPTCGPVNENEEPTSKIEEPLAVFTDLVSNIVSELIEEKGADSVAHKLTEKLNEQGYPIGEGQMEEVLSGIANSDVAEIVEMRDGIDVYIEAVVKELFVRLGTKINEKDDQLLIMVQNIIIKFGAQASMKQAGGKIPERGAEFYNNLTLDLLKTLGLNGPEDLDCVPVAIREMVWEKLSGEMIGNKLKGIVDGMFNPHFIRVQIVNALERMNKGDTDAHIQPVANEEPQGVVSTVQTFEEYRAAGATQDAFGNIYKFLVSEFMGDGRLVDLTLKNASIVQKVGQSLEAIMTNTLVEKYGDENGKPSLKNLLVDVLSSVAPGLRADLNTPENAEKAERLYNSARDRVSAAEQAVESAERHLEDVISQEAVAVENIVKANAAGCVPVSWNPLTSVLKAEDSAITIAYDAHKRIKAEKIEAEMNLRLAQERLSSAKASLVKAQKKHEGLVNAPGIKPEPAARDAFQTSENLYKQAKEKHKAAKKAVKEARAFKVAVANDASGNVDNTKLTAAKEASKKAKASLTSAIKDLQVAEFNRIQQKYALAIEQKQTKEKMIELIEQLSKNQAKAFTNNLWIGFRTAFSATMKTVYAGEVSPETERFFTRLGEIIFLNILGSIFSGSGYLASLLFKKAALRADRFLDENETKMANLSYTILEEIQHGLLNGPSRNAVVAATEAPVSDANIAPVEAAVEEVDYRLSGQIDESPLSNAPYVQLDESHLSDIPFAENL